MLTASLPQWARPRRPFRNRVLSERLQVALPSSGAAIDSHCQRRSQHGAAPSQVWSARSRLL